jgi:hypothetical protein
MCRRGCLGISERLLLLLRWPPAKLRRPGAQTPPARVPLDKSLNLGCSKSAVRVAAAMPAEKCAKIIRLVRRPLHCGGSAVSPRFPRRRPEGDAAGASLRIQAMVVSLQADLLDPSVDTALIEETLPGRAEPAEQGPARRVRGRQRPADGARSFHSIAAGSGRIGAEYPLTSPATGAAASWTGAGAERLNVLRSDGRTVLPAAMTPPTVPMTRSCPHRSNIASPSPCRHLFCLSGRLCPQRASPGPLHGCH